MNLKHAYRRRIFCIAAISLFSLQAMSQPRNMSVPGADTNAVHFSHARHVIANRWSKDKAWKWYHRQPWICGVNYIPRNAINYTAMWDKTSFSPDTIDQEFALAEKVGFNTVRVVLQYLVWEDDPAYFKETFARFLTICARHHIRVLPCFFDDCYFGVNVDPTLGKQLKPYKGWYAWAWSPSPGHSRVVNPAYYPMLGKYVHDVMETFKNDKRILAWDLYNEPTNGGLGNKSLPLLRKVFQWAREVNPSQPVTVALFDNNKKLNDIILAHSDIITFHDYSGKEEVTKKISVLKQQGRPVICTEWLNRPRHSTVEDVLPVFYQNDIGCLSWGLVNGDTQTDLPWGHRPGDPPPEIWQHDLYHRNMTPYKEDELVLFKKYTTTAKKRAGVN